MCVRACVHVRAQSRLTLCEPTDCSPPRSSVHGTSQARIPEWVAISSTMRSSSPRTEPTSLVSPALAGRFFTPRLIIPAGNSLAVQWLGLQALTAEGPGLIPGQGQKVHKPHSAAKRNKSFHLMDIIKKYQYCLFYSTWLKPITFFKRNTVPPHRWITKSLPHDVLRTHSGELHRLQAPGITTTLLFTQKTHQPSPDKFLYSRWEIWYVSPWNLRTWSLFPQ